MFCMLSVVKQSYKHALKNLPLSQSAFKSSSGLNKEITKPLKPLPMSIADFQDLKASGYLYIDKTKGIYSIANSLERRACFLSRPRRFGKSLLISTFKHLFSGNKELFKDTWIYNSDWKWEKYPIIHLDMSKVSANSIEGLESNITKQLKAIANEYNIEIDLTGQINSQMDDLITKLSKNNKVVILIDEYDAPILNLIDDTPKAEKIRDVLKLFYTIIKSQGALERFVFITGVTKFSHTSLFSGMNQLTDLTLDPRNCTLLGYTEAEIRENFHDYLKTAAEKNDTSFEDLMAKMKRWYNGYRFSKSKDRVYNPFSLHYFFDSQEFANYWFSSGTPTLLFKLMKKNNYDIEKIKDICMSREALLSFDINQIPWNTLLYQTGYITVTDYDKENDLYTLNYPNNEVELSFFNYFLGYFAGNQAQEEVKSAAILLSKALKQNDLQSFFDILHSFFVQIPYDMHIEEEKFYHAIFFVIFKILGFKIECEVKTNVGRIDLVITTEKIIYVIEVKLNGKPQQALNQILSTKYYETYLNSGKDIVLVGTSFKMGKGNRNIEKNKWVSQKIPSSNPTSIRRDNSLALS